MKVRDSIQNEDFFFYSSHNMVMEVNSVASFRALKSFRKTSNFYKLM
jgi:hypothetical protein